MPSVVLTGTFYNNSASAPLTARCVLGDHVIFGCTLTVTVTCKASWDCSETRGPPSNDGKGERCWLHSSELNGKPNYVTPNLVVQTRKPRDPPLTGIRRFKILRFYTITFALLGCWNSKPSRFDPMALHSKLFCMLFRERERKKKKRTPNKNITRPCNQTRSKLAKTFSFRYRPESWPRSS